MNAQLPINVLYEQDYYLWLETTLNQLKRQDINHLDWAHLIEEIEALGSEQRRKAESYLKQVLIHLLLYQYWKTERSYCGNGWKGEIRNFRDELEFLLRSQTLYNYLLPQVERIYSKARKIAIDKTGLDEKTFPDSCPFSIEDILNSEYWPEE